MIDANTKAAPAADVTRGLEFLAGGGEMGAAMRSHDWAATPLGPAHLWPQSLKTTIRILLSSRYAMWMAWGPELTFFCNDAYKPTLGVKSDRALGQRSDHVWAEIWPDIGPRIDTVLRTGTATWDENLLLFLERSGFPEETYHTFSYSPLANDGGAIVGMLCVVTETTERVIAERRMMMLRDLAAEFTLERSLEDVCPALTEILGDRPDIPLLALYLFDDDASGQATRICFVGPSADRGRFPLLLRPEDTGPLPVTRILAGRGPVVIDDLPARFGGPLSADRRGTAMQEIVLVPLMRGQDQINGFLAIGLNPYRRYDTGYAGFINLLAGQIEANLVSVRLFEEERERVEALAEIDRAKTAFFSNVSHEFRTPLTLMLGPLEEILAKSPPHVVPENHALVEIAHRNGLRLLKLVNTLLDFSRLEAGRAQAQYSPVDLAAFTTELAASFESAITRAGLAYRVDCQPLPSPVYVDAGMWEKIVLNLLSNAFKFTLAGEIVVSLKASADGHTAILIVTDTGTGIAPEALPHLFKRFYRVTGTKGRSFEGSGIGLALVQELVRLHGGAIAVESEPGRGSSFIVTIPIGTAHLPVASIVSAEPVTPAIIESDSFVAEALRWLPDAGANAAIDESLPVAADADLPPPPLGTGQHILLADDNADMRDYIRRLLATEGYSVEAVADGEAALAAARNRMPDLILSDVMMPGMDGMNLLKTLRTDALLRHTPVIFLSARAGEESRIEGMDAGADDYLVKPFAARELLSRVARNLQVSRFRRETEKALMEEAATLEILGRVGAMVSAELNLDAVVQAVTDAATRLTGAAFGAFFYNVQDNAGGSYMLYTLSGVPREAFSKFPMPRNTEIFAPTFGGKGIVRSADITLDPRYGRNAPYKGMPEGHLPVRSYLASSVISRNGEVLGGLFFGHPEAGMFDERSERLLSGIAAQAAIAIDNAQLYKAAQIEIAERQKTEAALRESEARFRTMADNAPVIIWVTDPQGQITYINPRWTDLTGQSLEESLGTGSLEPIHPEDRDRALATFMAANEKREAFQVEYRLRRHDGQYRWMHGAAMPRFDSQDNFLGYIGSVIDLTDRKNMEDQQELLLAVARDVNATLERKVNERTHALTAANERLRNEINERARAEEALGHAQKMEAIGQLTGGVAHDFNNLLTVIMGNVETLQRQLRRDTPDIARMQRALDSAARGAERAASLTQRLLAFSRRAPLEPRAVDVNMLVSGMSDLLRRTLGEQVTVDAQPGHGLWPVHVDPNQLENVLLNLAVNARDAMPGGGRLTITTANAGMTAAQIGAPGDMMPGDYVRITVSDNGIGMSREVMEQAFEPFFTTKDVGHGTGLGLSQVYGFVKQSGGHVRLDSMRGEGTTVTIYLPRLQAASAPGDDAMLHREPEPPRQGSETILVVEDDPDVRAHSRDILGDLGYRIIEAGTGQDALDILSRHNDIALMFTDIGLPGGMNGRDLAQAAQRRYPKLKVLFTSGYAQTAVVHHGRLDEGVQLITKPFSYMALATKVRDILDADHRPGPAAPKLLFVEDDVLMLSVMVDGLIDQGYRVEVATTAQAAIAILCETPTAFDAAVIDIGLPDMRGEQLLLELRKLRADLPVVIASGYGRAVLKQRFAGISALSFIDKPYIASELAVVLAAAGVPAVASV